MRKLNYANAIKEATDFCLEVDQSVLVIGLGVPDPKGILEPQLAFKKNMAMTV